MFDLLIIDGRHLLHRSFDVNKNLHVEIDGEYVGTGGIFGFLNSLTSIHRRHKGIVLIAWEGKNNFRYRLYKEYKKRKRERTIDEVQLYQDMIEQENRLKKILSMIGILQYSGVGCEADDVIGTLTTKFASYNVGVYSGDSDMRQLATRSISIVAPGFKGKEVVYTPEKVFEKHGVEPFQIPDLKALAGDSSDNIPGVPGIGPKKAVQLLDKYQSVESVILAAAGNDEGWPIPDRFKEIIDSNLEKIALFQSLTNIKTDVELIRIKPKRDLVQLRKEFLALKFKVISTPMQIHAFSKMVKPNEKTTA